MVVVTQVNEMCGLQIPMHSNTCLLCKWSFFILENLVFPFFSVKIRGMFQSTVRMLPLLASLSCCSIQH